MIEADQVVVATGPFQTPYVPESPKSSRPTSFRRTASATAGPSDVRTGPCSWSEAATPATSSPRSSRRRTVVLSVGSRQKPLPQRLLGRDLFWWLTKVRILDKTVDSRMGRKLSTRDTLIGSRPAR